MENFDRENINELLEILQIRQYFPCQFFAPYSTYNYVNACITYHHVSHDHITIFGKSIIILNAVPKFIMTILTFLVEYMLNKNT